jgi:hypothetical protein
MRLHVDIENDPEEIVRLVVLQREPVPVLRGGKVELEQKLEHRGVLKAPEVKAPEGATEIEPDGTLKRPPSQIER